MSEAREKAWLKWTKDDPRRHPTMDAFFAGWDARKTADFKESHTAKPKYRCMECHSTNIEHLMWVNPNNDVSGEIFGTWNENGSSFCNNCESDRRIEDIPESNNDETVQEEADREMGCEP